MFDPSSAYGTIRDMTQLWRSFGYQSITARLYSLPSVVTTPGKPRKISKKSRKKERCSTKNGISTEDWSWISKCCRYLSFMCYVLLYDVKKCLHISTSHILPKKIALISAKNSMAAKLPAPRDACRCSPHQRCPHCWEVRWALETWQTWS